MILNESDLNRIYFLTRTYLSKEKINTLALSENNFDDLLYRIRQHKWKNLDKDWSLFDYNFKKDKLIYARNFKIINEKEIFRGTYIHQCKNDFKYLIYIIENSGYCKRCDTQFFPKLWWNSENKEKMNYYEIKYGYNLLKKRVKLNEEYEKKLLNYGVDKNILNKVMTQIHSEIEIEKNLQTKYYDLKNPPPPVKIHEKLITLYNVWNIKPVTHLGIHPDKEFFFHSCINNLERILFQEKYFYTWCPSCFTKFIPEWDINCINNYHNLFTVNCYVKETYQENYEKKKPDKEELIKSSDEYFYLSILGLNKRTSIKEILNTFRHLSKIYHPDIGGDSNMFQKIVKAKEWLVKFYKYSIPGRIEKEEPDNEADNAK